MTPDSTVIIAAGFVAALLHWPIDDRPLPRVAAQVRVAEA